MILKKTICLAILTVLVLASIQAQMNLDNSVLEFADYKVDNDFINSKDINHTLFGDSYNYHLKDFNGIDIAFGKGK